MLEPFGLTMCILLSLNLRSPKKEDVEDDHVTPKKAVVRRCPSKSPPEKAATPVHVAETQIDDEPRPKDTSRMTPKQFAKMMYEKLKGKGKGKGASSGWLVPLKRKQQR